MTSQNVSVTAFRVFGKFHWPPLPGRQVEADTRAGVVEIHYVAEAENLYVAEAETVSHGAWLRWLPKDYLNGEVSTVFDPDPKAPFVHALSANQLNGLFHGADAVVLRLDKGGPADHAEERLLFRGARVFDQFILDKNSNYRLDESDPKRHLRLILANGHKEWTTTLFSELVIGREADEPSKTGLSIHFNLALPTVTTQRHIDNKPLKIISFNVGYSPLLTLPINGSKSAAPINSFMAGSSADGALNDEPEDFSFDLDPDKRALGTFGLGYKRGNEKEFVHYPKKKNFDRGAYWINYPETFRDELLNRLGNAFQLNKDAFIFANNPAPRPAQGEEFDSVRFIAGSDVTTIIVRTGIKTLGVKNSPLGDVVIDGGEFFLRNPANPKQLIQTGSRNLCVELELRYELKSEEVWAAGEEDVADPSIVARLGFSSKINGAAGDLTDPPAELTARATVDAVLNDAIRGMRLARLDLKNIEAPQPQSALPGVQIVADNKKRRFALMGTIPASFGKDGAISWGRRSVRGQSWSGLEPRLSLWPDRYVDNRGPFDKSALSTLKLSLSLYSLGYPPGGGSVDPIPALLAHDPAASAGIASAFCQFQLVADGAGKTLQARLGGLAFERASASLHEEEDEQGSDYSHWRFGPRASLRDDNTGTAFAATEVDFRLRLPIDHVTPVGVDMARPDRDTRPRPLLIPFAVPGAAPPPPSDQFPYVLDLRETVSANADRQLVAQLAISGKSAGPDRINSYVVLGEQPFSIARFRSQALSDRGSLDNAFVATYDSDTREWQFKRVSSSYHYEFPPQVAGESMDKPRRLEILDADGTPGDGTVYRPAEGDTNGVMRQRAVQFRLSPSAEIWIEPSDVERNYFLPEWASHSIFRQTGAYGLGAALQSLRGEFLYGLTVGIDTSHETGPARGARVAEIEALTGVPLGKPRSSNPNPHIARRWTAVGTAIARRPERLEVWNRDFDSTSKFTWAEFASGVTFALRATAVHREALPSTEPDGAWNKVYSAGPRIRKHGLAGGALWPIESANLLRRLLGAPASQGGRISNIALSPSGGDADQKATFLRGQVAIISETRNGFVQRLKIEVLGRIGAHWHRAKHVVQYERTANPTAQFAPETPPAGAPTRRTVLRKVSEYIELIEHERTYPDFPAAPAGSAGFLESIRYNRKIINVDSAWSEDVDNFGWQIPLWNRSAALRRPQVYPRPDLSFITRSEGEGDDARVAQECLDPDNIYFFADFKIGGSDTDSWPSRIGIDASALPAPRHDHQILNDSGAGDGNSRAANALRVPRGHRRFTWRLAPPARKTTINAGRADQPIYAGLETVTFMRSAPVSGSALETKLEAALKQIKTQPPQETKSFPYWEADKPPEDVAVLAQKLEVYRKATDENTTIAAAADYRSELVKLKAKLDGGDLKQYLADADAIGKKVGVFGGLAKDLPARCHKMVDDLVTSLNRKQLQILDGINGLETFAYGQLEDRSDFPIDTLKEKLHAAIEKEIKAAFQEGTTEVADRLRIGQNLEKARAVIRDFESEVQALRQALGARLDAMRQAYGDSKPWSEGRLQTFLDKLTAERNGVLTDIHTAITEAQARLATELDDVSRGVAAALVPVIARIEGNGSALKTALGELKDLLGMTFNKVTDAIEDLLKSKLFTEADTKLVELMAQHPGSAAELDKARGLIKKLPSALTETHKALKGISTTVDYNAALILACIASATPAIAGSLSALTAVTTKLSDIATSASGAAAEDLRHAVNALADDIDQKLMDTLEKLTAIEAAISDLADNAFARAESALSTVAGEIDGLLARAEDANSLIVQRVKEVTSLLATDAIVVHLQKNVTEPLLKRLFDDKGFTDKIDLTIEANRRRLRAAISGLADNAEAVFKDAAETKLADLKKELTDHCQTLGCGLDDVTRRLENFAMSLLKDLDDQLKFLDEFKNEADKLRKGAERLEADIRQVTNELSTAYSTATNYVEKVIDTAGNLGNGGLASAPNNFLKLYAAVASAPSLPNLDFARERLGYYYGQLQDVIDTTPVEAWFGRLGDELKAMGLSLPFSRLGDRLLPDDLSSLDISRVLKNFGGIKFDQLFKGYKLPASAKDAIKISHAFDKKAFKAWVQIDVDLPLPGRQSLFTVGPVQVDFVGARMEGQVRLEASKDGDAVEQTGHASVGTDIEVIVAGQTMVSLQKVKLHYERSSGLKVDFDPKNIRLNSIFQFVQDTLGSLFPNEIGALKLIKENGIPVGVEHEFSMPPVSMMFGTSGVSNLQIANHFSLVAFPDFIIADRFSLSKPEMPFLFSLFIIGGTGYITIDAEYRPFRNRLMVMVEAAAGGSAALGFAFGPISGGVFITLSVALGYRKLIGQSGGGLNVALVLVVAGNVSVAGIVTIYIGLQLRLSYRDNGDIDAAGSLIVRIKISCFFTLTARADAKYKLRNGKSQTTTSSSVDVDGELSKAAKDAASKVLSQRG